MYRTISTDAGRWSRSGLVPLPTLARMAHQASRVGVDRDRGLTLVLTWVRQEHR